MKKTRKLLSLLLSVVIILGTFVVTTSAEDMVVEEEVVDGVSDITIKTSADTVKAGDVITVTINVATDYNSTNMRWPVLFSSSFFEFTEGSDAFTEDLLKLNGRATVVTNSTDIKNFTAEYTPENYKCVLIQWSGITPYNNPEGADIFTFELRVKDDVVMGMSGDIVIGNEDTFYTQMIRPGVEEPSFSDLVQGNIAFNCTNAHVAFPVPDLVPVEGTSTVIDKENNLIRGIGFNVVDNIDDYARAVGCDEVIIVPSKDNIMGTGTTITLMYEGEVWASYTIVIAGDVNGDGLVDIIDYLFLDLMESSEMILSGAQTLAADLDGNGEVTSADKIALDSHLIFEGEINQVTGKYVAL